MSKFLLDKTLSNSQWRTLEDIENTENLDFESLVKAAGLDPKNDFKYSNLSGVDFSNANLRGFDFSGANLTCCFGVDVKWDESTIFKGARVDCSVFSHNLKQNSKFNKNPIWMEEFTNLQGKYWADQILWFAASKSARENSEKVKISTIGYELYDSTQDPVVKSNILYFLTGNFDARETDHRDFLINVICNNSEDSIDFKSAFSVLCTVYQNVPEVLGIILRYIDCTNEKIRMLVYGAVFSSKLYGKCSSTIDEFILNESSKVIRRFYLAKRAFAVNKIYAAAIRDPNEQYAIDLQTPIGDQLVSSIAYSWARSENVKRAISKGPKRAGRDFVALDPSNIGVGDRHHKNKIKLVREILLTLKHDGVPLKIEFVDE